MHWLASFVMGGRLRAMFVAAAGAVTALAAPPLTSPLSYLGGAVIALATLRFGYREGLLLLAAAAVLTAGLGHLALGHAQAVALAALLLWIPAWLLALVLRNSASLALTMQVAALLGIAALFGVYLAYGDPAAWWQQALTPIMTPLLEQAGFTMAPEQWLQRMARIMTGVLVGATVLGLMMTLFLARALQASLDNPGGFRRDFHGLRLRPAMGWLTMGLVAVAQLGDGLAAALAMQTAIILLVQYLVVGLALIHGAAGIVKVHPGWLIAVYVLMLLVPPQTMLVLTMIGLSDSWLDIRGRLRKARSGMS